jgi:diguanylate cyclase (GGDEF)-like protein
VTGPPGIRFYAGAPILGPDGQPMGTLCALDRVPRQPSKAQIAQLARLARAVGSTLHLHASLHQLQMVAETDPLTGITNRAGFVARLEAALENRRAEDPTGRGASGQRTALLMLDLDRFKTVNDLFGHAGGDTVLREVARRLRAVVRSSDIVGRLGGDEFGIVLSRIEIPPNALGVADRIHGALADSFALNGQAVPLRTSIGIAVAPEHGGDAASLLAHADAALYAAKQAGRGCVRLAAGAGAPAVAGQVHPG